MKERYFIIRQHTRERTTGPTRYLPGPKHEEGGGILGVIGGIAAGIVGLIIMIGVVCGAASSYHDDHPSDGWGMAIFIGFVALAILIAIGVWADKK